MLNLCSDCFEYCWPSRSSESLRNSTSTRGSFSFEDDESNDEGWAGERTSSIDGFSFNTSLLNTKNQTMTQPLIDAAATPEQRGSFLGTGVSSVTSQRTYDDTNLSQDQARESTQLRSTWLTSLWGGATPPPRSATKNNGYFLLEQTSSPELRQEPSMSRTESDGPNFFDTMKVAVVTTAKKPKELLAKLQERSEKKEAELPWGSPPADTIFRWEDLRNPSQEVQPLGIAFTSFEESPRLSTSEIIAGISTHLTQLQEKINAFSETRGLCSKQIDQFFSSPLLQKNLRLKKGLLSTPSQEAAAEGQPRVFRHPQQAQSINTEILSLAHQLKEGPRDPLTEDLLCSEPETISIIDKLWLLWDLSSAFYIFSGIEKLETYYHDQKALFDQRLSKFKEEPHSPLMLPDSSLLYKLHDSLLQEASTIEKSVTFLEKLIQFNQHETPFNEAIALPLLESQYRSLAESKLGKQEFLNMAYMIWHGYYHYHQAMDLLLEELFLLEDRQTKGKEYHLRATLHALRADQIHAFKDLQPQREEEEPLPAASAEKEAKIIPFLRRLLQRTPQADLLAREGVESMKPLDKNQEAKISQLLRRALKVAPPSSLPDEGAQAIQKKYYFEILKSSSQAAQDYGAKKSSALVWEGVAKGLEEALSLEQSWYPLPDEQSDTQTKEKDNPIRQWEREMVYYYNKTLEFTKDSSSDKEKWSYIPAYLEVARTFKRAIFFQEKLDQGHPQLSAEDLAQVIELSQAATKAYRGLLFAQGEHYYQEIAALTLPKVGALPTEYQPIWIGKESSITSHPCP